jgi:hypothetical protein
MPFFVMAPSSYLGNESFRPIFFMTGLKTDII